MAMETDPEKKRAILVQKQAMQNKPKASEEVHKKLDKKKTTPALGKNIIELRGAIKSEARKQKKPAAKKDTTDTTDTTTNAEAEADPAAPLPPIHEDEGEGKEGEEGEGEGEKNEVVRGGEIGPAGEFIEVILYTIH
jgi:hypothetical protein